MANETALGDLRVQDMDDDELEELVDRLPDRELRARCRRGLYAPRGAGIDAVRGWLAGALESDRRS